MVEQTQEGLTSQWLDKKLASVPSNKTVAILVDENDVKEQKLDCLKHLYGSKEFLQDLTLSKSAWIYTNDAAMRRCLVIQHKAAEVKDGQTDEQKRIAQGKTMRGLAVNAVSAL